MLSVINKLTANNPLDSTIQEQMLQNSWKLLKLRLKHKFTKMNNFNETKLILMKIGEEMTNDYGWERLGFNNYQLIEISGNHSNMLNEKNSNNLANLILQNL